MAKITLTDDEVRLTIDALNTALDAIGGGATEQDWSVEDEESVRAVRDRLAAAEEERAL